MELWFLGLRRPLMSVKPCSIIVILGSTPQSMTDDRTVDRNGKLESVSDGVWGYDIILSKVLRQHIVSWKSKFHTRTEGNQGLYLVHICKDNFQKFKTCVNLTFISETKIQYNFTSLLNFQQFIYYFDQKCLYDIDMFFNEVFSEKIVRRHA